MRPTEVVDLALAIEDAGFDRLGISDVAFWPDCFMLLMQCGAATRRIHLGPMVTNPYTLHPVIIAAAMASLQEQSNGRGFLGIGVGAGLEPLEVDQRNPASALREAIIGIRQLLKGAPVQLTGEKFPIRGGHYYVPQMFLFRFL